MSTHSENILYLHGLGSNGASSTAAALRTAGLRVLSPDYSPQNYTASIAWLQDYVDLKGISLLVGTSMGGYYALKLSELTGLRAVAVNACFEPARLLAEYLSNPAPDYDSGGTIVFTQDLLDAFEPLHSENIPAPVIIIGEQDDTIPAAWQKDFCKKQDWPWLMTGWGHRVGDAKRLADVIRSHLTRC